MPSLIGIWATAPFLHNNEVGTYTGDPSVAGRMKAFDDATTRLLWPAKRAGQASIARTTVDSYLEIPTAYLPEGLRGLARRDTLRIGPIPAGTPVDLLANTDLDLSDPSRAAERVRLTKEVIGSLAQIHGDGLDAKQAQAVLRGLVPDLLKVSKSPDYILDRGHYFGTELSDADKRALIEYMKTF